MTHSRCSRTASGKRSAIAAALLLLAGCGSLSDGNQPRQAAAITSTAGGAVGADATKGQGTAPDGTSASVRQSDGRDAGGDVALAALALIGVPYLFGSDDPARGVDCSGLVRHAFRASLNLELPRLAEQMAARGEAVSAAELRAGDLVFFNTLGHRHSHVGIYIGDRQFVHAPTARGAVRIDLLDTAYWHSRFDGARRVAGPATDPAAGASTATP